MIDNKIYESLLNRTNIIVNKTLVVDNTTALKGLELMCDILDSIDTESYNVIQKSGEYKVNMKGGVFN